MNMTETKATGYCFRCQQHYRITVLYRITHICRQCRNGLIDVWAQVTKGK